MTPEQATALATYAARQDKRVQATEATFQTWARGLARVEFEWGMWAIQEHYSAAPGPSGLVPMASPGALRARISYEKERRAARARAITSKPQRQQTTSWRERHPGAWREGVRRGQHEAWQRAVALGSAEPECPCGCGATAERLASPPSIG